MMERSVISEPAKAADRAFWSGKKVFVTGNTGFKGAWLSLWLHSLGARVSGYSLAPPTDPSLFGLAQVADCAETTIGDVRDGALLAAALQTASPDIVIHMAAQPLVRESYRLPVLTYETNVMGTVNLLEAVRNCPSVRSVVVVTTDKCYENREWHWGYREHEPFGGYDPYSSSKACTELVTSAYRNSFFSSPEAGTAVASARAGNVIGGGDWAADRLIPDCIRALLKGEQILIRNPHSIRPWQHVLEPVAGYLLLAQRLWEGGAAYAEGWNFGPSDDDARPVGWIVQKMCDKWGEQAAYAVAQGEHPHEAHYLKLDCSKAKARLGWQPRWNLETALDKIIEWTDVYRKDGDLRSICLEQIDAYSAS